MIFGGYLLTGIFYLPAKFRCEVLTQTKVALDYR